MFFVCFSSISLRGAAAASVYSALYERSSRCKLHAVDFCIPVGFDAWSVRVAYALCDGRAISGALSGDKKVCVHRRMNFGISVVAVFVNGLVGVTLGTLVANVYRTTQYAAYASKHLLDRKFGVFAKKCLWLCINVIVIVLVKTLLPEIAMCTWGLWIANGFYCFFISLAVTLGTAFLFYREELKESLRVVERMLGSKRMR